MFEHDLIIILSYGLLGAGIKYIDQAYDLGVFTKKKANIVAIPLGIIMASLIIFDPPSATILFAMFIALAITQKIDNPAFYIGAGILLLIPIIFHDILKMEWLPFGILIFSGIADEVGNDWADKRMNKKMVNHSSMVDSSLHRVGEKFFLKRFMMKVAILFLVIFSFFPWVYLFAFLFFDVMYLLVEWYSLGIKVYTISKPDAVWAGGQDGSFV